MKDKRIYIPYGSSDIEILTKWKTEQLIKESVKKNMKEILEQVREDALKETKFRDNQIFEILKELRK